MENIELVGNFISLIMIAFSLVFTLGIIWRVEMKLDMAYKVFFCGLVFLFISKLMDFFVKSELFLIVSQMFDVLFSALLLLGIWLMRDLMRDIDGEKK